MARPRAEAAIQPESVDLPFPLVLGLFGRADDEPRPSTRWTSSTGSWTPRHLAPFQAAAAGSRLRDNGETPDTQDALFEYDGWTATWSHREASRGAAPTRGLEFCGTEGSLLISRKGFALTPDPKLDPELAVPRFGGAHPVGGPRGSERGDAPGLRTSPIEDRSGDEFDQFRRHARDFLDCVRSRKEPFSRPRDRSSRGDRLSSGQPLAPAGPKAEVGRAIARRSSMIPRPRRCSNAPTAPPGTGTAMLL